MAQNMRLAMKQMNPTRVKKLRRRLRWTQRKLAEQMGVCRRTVQYWEKRGCPAMASTVLRTLE